MSTCSIAVQRPRCWRQIKGLQEMPVRITKSEGPVWRRLKHALVWGHFLLINFLEHRVMKQTDVNQSGSSRSRHWSSGRISEAQKRTCPGGGTAMRRRGEQFYGTLTFERRVGGVTSHKTSGARKVHRNDVAIKVRDKKSSSGVGHVKDTWNRSYELVWSQYRTWYILPMFVSPNGTFRWMFMFYNDCRTIHPSYIFFSIA